MEPTNGTSRDTFQSSVSIDQAAATLNVSPSTVRRWVKEGRLPSERVTTPQGHVFRVHLPPEGAETRSAEPSKAGATAPSTAPVMARSAERAEAMAAYNAALIAPLVAELAETRVRLLGQADRIASQAEEIGGIRAQLSQSQAELRALKAPQEPQDATRADRRTAHATDPGKETSTPWWRRWWAWAGVAR